METATGDGGEGPRPEHFDGADGARTKNGMHLPHEYNRLASEAMERGQATTGAAAGEDGHGATVTIAGPRIVEEGDENPRRALLAHEPDGGETEARGPPKKSRALNASGRQGGEGDPTPISTRPWRAAGARGDHRTQ